MMNLQLLINIFIIFFREEKMKTLFTLVAMSSFALASAAQPDSGYGYDNPDKVMNADVQSVDVQDPSGNIDVSIQESDDAYQVQQPATTTMDTNVSKSALSKEDMVKKIREMLTSVTFSKGLQVVTLDFADGKVTITGTVDSQENKDKVGDLVKKIDGVTSVDNQLTVTK